MFQGGAGEGPHRGSVGGGGQGNAPSVTVLPIPFIAERLPQPSWRFSVGALRPDGKRQVTLDGQVMGRHGAVGWPGMGRRRQERGWSRGTGRTWGRAMEVARTVGLTLQVIGSNRGYVSRGGIWRGSGVRRLPLAARWGPDSEGLGCKRAGQGSPMSV